MGQRGDQQLRRVRLRIAGAVQVEQTVGRAAADRRQPIAQLRLGQGSVPYRIIVGEKTGGLVLGVADQQRDVIGESGRGGVAGLLRQIATVDDRAEIVAIEQWELSTPDRPLRRCDRGDQLLDRDRPQPVDRVAGHTELL